MQTSLLRSSFRHSSSRSAPVTYAYEAKEAWEEARPFDEIPGPKTYPIIKSLPSFLPIIGGSKAHEHLLNFFKNMYNDYGNIIRIEFGTRKKIFLCDPTIIEEALKRGVGKWPERETFQYFRKYRMEVRKEWYGTPGVIAANGEEWYKIRSKVQPPMMSPKACLHYIPSMDQVAADFIDHIRATRLQTGELPTNFTDELYKWALESICLVALNTKFGCFTPESVFNSETKEMLENVQIALKAMAKLEYSSLKLWKYFMTKDMKMLARGFDATSKICLEKIHAAKEKLQNKLNNNYDGELSILEKFLLTPGLSVNDAHTMAMDMLFAGVSTTGNTAGFLLHLLGNNPEAQWKLYKEVSSVMPSPETPLTSKALAMLPFMKACVKEAMRIFPVTIGFPRLIQQDIVLQGYQIPKGVEVIFSNAMYHQEKHFPDPWKFKPERWLKGSAEHHTINPYTFFPFGHGPRMCIGRRLAEQEIWLLITRIIRNFSVESLQEDMGLAYQLIVFPDRPLKFKFLERH